MATGGALGRLNVLLGLDSTEFTRGLTKAEYTSKQQMDKIARNAKIAGAAIAGAFVVAGAAAAAAAKKSIDHMDAMSKLAQSTGVAIESLTGLGYAADLSGINVETLGAGMVRLTKGMSDAAKGTGDAKDAFDALGISVKDEEGNLKSADVMLGDIADRFANFKDGAEKTALAVAIFGRSGAQMVPMLNAGKRGLKDMTDEAQRFGLVLEQKAASAAEEFNDNLFRLKSIQQGYIHQITAQVLPQLNNFVELLLDGATEAKGLKSEIDDLTDATTMPEWLDALGIGLARVIDVAVLLGRAINAVANSFKVVAADADLVVKGLAAMPTQPWNWFSDKNSKAFKEALDNRNKILETANKAYADLMDIPGNKFEQAWITGREKAAFDRNFVGPMPQDARELAPVIVKPSTGGGKGGKGGAGSLDQGARLIAQMNERIALIGKETEYEKLLAQISVGSMAFRTQEQQDHALALAQTIDVMSQAEKDAAAFKSLMDSLYPERAKADEFIDSVTLLHQAFAEGALTLEAYTEALGKLEDKFNDTKDEATEFAIQAARNIQQSLGDGLYSVLTGQFDNIGQSFAQMLARMAADAAAAQLAKAMFGDFGNTGSIGGWVGSLLGFAGGGYTGDGSKYDPAGIVHRGEYVMTKEATSRIGVPALDRLNRGYTAGGLGGRTPGVPALAGQPPNVEINVINQSSQPVQAKQGPMRFDGKRLIQDVILSDTRVNGPITRAMKGVLA